LDRLAPLPPPPNEGLPTNRALVLLLLDSVLESPNGRSGSTFELQLSMLFAMATVANLVSIVDDEIGELLPFSTLPAIAIACRALLSLFFVS
jgi:hypothetical protein